MNTGLAIAMSLPLLTCIVWGIGLAVATSKAADAVARQPEAGDRIQTMLIIGGALIEATAVYGLLAVLLLAGKVTG